MGKSFTHHENINITPYEQINIMQSNHVTVAHKLHVVYSIAPPYHFENSTFDDHTLQLTAKKPQLQTSLGGWEGNC